MIQELRLFKSKNNNIYFHSKKRNQFFLVHPFMQLILNELNNEADINLLVEKFSNKSININGKSCRFSHKQVLFYINKVKFLAENDFLADFDFDSRFSGRVSESLLSFNLTNTDQVVFEVTDDCNLDCKYCAYGKFYTNFDERKKAKISFSSALKLLRFIVDNMNSSRHMALHKKLDIGFYGGEPLLNFSFIKKMVQYTKENFPDIKFTYSMTTNGVLLDKYIDFLVANNFNLLISLDGNEEHNGYRVTKENKPSYPIIRKNLDLVKEKYPDYFYKRTMFNALLHKRNSVEEIYRFFKRTFNKIPKIAELSPFNISQDKWDEVLKTYKNVRESFNEADERLAMIDDMFLNISNIRLLTEIIYRLSGYAWLELDQMLIKFENQSFMPTGTCGPFSRKVFMTVNGKLLPCERISQNQCFGHADETGISINYNDMANFCNQAIEKISNQCKNCATNCLCMQCIFNLDFRKDKPSCRMSSDNNYLLKMFSDSFSLLEEKPDLFFKVMEDVTLD